jgi:sporulation protein YlmC with PRC-barrel domain
MMQPASSPTEETEDTKTHSRDLVGKKVVSKEGKTFGKVGDIVFETSSGELIHIVVDSPSAYLKKKELETNKAGELLIPFSAVTAIGDFLVVAEEDIV